MAGIVPGWDQKKIIKEKDTKYSHLRSLRRLWRSVHEVVLKAGK
jgi:hypothetical protein